MLCRLKKIVAITAAALLATAGPAWAMDWDYVQQVRQHVADHDPAYQPAMDRLIEQANGALKEGPWSVTQKKMLPPSGNSKDYISFGPYWWPDPSKPNGLPYIQRDGQRNPDAAKNSDRDRLENTIQTVTTLGLAYYLTGNTDYAKHAELVLRVFFIDPKTGMNPNLNFAQGVPGIVQGRGTGIIDLNSLSDMMDAVKLIEQTAPTDVWPDSTRKGFHEWSTQFLNWLNTSSNGHDEMAATNNHGDWFDATSSIFADYVGDKELIKTIVGRSEKRIAAQIEADGNMPEEMRRTKSWHYCMFALEAFTITSERAHRAGLDLWHFKPENPKAGTCDDAVARLLHYTETKEPWPKKDIGEFEDPTGFYMHVRSVLDPQKDGDLCKRLEAAVAAKGPEINSMRQQLIFVHIAGAPQS